MTKTQIQSEIQKLLETVPEDVLRDLLEFLKTQRDITGLDVGLKRNLRQILEEDKELLEKLAR
ncbi:MAG: hypothetical protein ACKOAV_03260 [Bacteroidota bacterium]|jgi:hypothetical protein